MLKQQTRTWTVRDLMKVCIDLLQKQGIEEARLNVELLLSHALQCPRIQLYTNFDKPLTREEIRIFRSLVERRLNREPVQYIVGWTGFMGLHFAVDPRVFIPRPETETLVEQAMMLFAKQPLNVLDIGTGCGNIAVSLARFCKNCSVVGLDISESALDVARSNARQHKVEDRVSFVRMDLFEPLDQLLLKRFDLVLSNPPYVPLDEYETLKTEVRRFEPREAITDEGDGLEFYRRLVELGPYLLNNGGVMMVEVGFGQAQRVAEMMQEAGFEGIQTIQDLQYVPRVVRVNVKARWRNSAAMN
jgi:release factor glutamine methyltransferase